MKTLLELEGVTAGYGAAPAIDQISCSVADRGVLAVLGANGAGKTTLMRAISGSLRIRSGSIRLRGDEISGLGPEERAVRGVTLCPEGRRILATLSVEENLRIGATALRRRTSRSRRRDAISVGIEEVYSRFPVLKERRRALGGTLSGGQQQMLAIGRALMAKPQVLLLDEPSLGLAPQVIDDVYELLRSLSAEGVALVLVEESSRRALDFAPAALVLLRGRVLLSGEARDVRDDPRLASAYLGEQALSNTV